MISVCISLSIQICQYEPSLDLMGSHLSIFKNGNFTESENSTPSPKNMHSKITYLHCLNLLFSAAIFLSNIWNLHQVGIQYSWNLPQLENGCKKWRHSTTYIIQGEYRGVSTQKEEKAHLKPLKRPWFWMKGTKNFC